MTPAIAIKRFNLDASCINAGRAKDLICPNCGHRRQFTVGVSHGIITLRGNGEVTGFTFGEFQPDYHCSCDECGEDGTISDFTCLDLDNTITRLAGLT